MQTNVLAAVTVGGEQTRQFELDVADAKPPSPRISVLSKMDGTRQREQEIQVVAQIKLGSSRKGDRYDAETSSIYICFHH